MKASGRNDAAVVEFTGTIQRILRIHQLGLKDRPNRYSRDVQYESRPLLGLVQDDLNVIESIIIQRIAE